MIHRRISQWTTATELKTSRCFVQNVLADYDRTGCSLPHLKVQPERRVMTPDVMASIENRKTCEAEYLFSRVTRSSITWSPIPGIYHQDPRYQSVLGTISFTTNTGRIPEKWQHWTEKWFSLANGGQMAQRSLFWREQCLENNCQLPVRERSQRPASFRNTTIRI